MSIRDIMLKKTKNFIAQKLLIGAILNKEPVLIIDYILDQISDINFVCDGYTSPLFTLVSSKETFDLNTLKLLIERGANIHIEDSSDGSSLLQHVISLNDADAIDLLIETGANIHHKDYNGKTILDYAKDEDLGKCLADILSTDGLEEEKYHFNEVNRYFMRLSKEKVERMVRILSTNDNITLNMLYNFVTVYAKSSKIVSPFYQPEYMVDETGIANVKDDVNITSDLYSLYNM